ncbi:hypothetical protein MUK42_14010 [Musa troglodytarum]|uniref:Uncharacterized protein n=1 Tax=Musa troglodytarum TaxID=320322 RepID=A0A9E7HVP0_9LILI|nr:hypothetical protein MUK42_14010 [Musa troglodytarum]
MWVYLIDVASLRFRLKCFDSATGLTVETVAIQRYKVSDPLGDANLKMNLLLFWWHVTQIATTYVLFTIVTLKRFLKRDIHSMSRY